MRLVGFLVARFEVEGDCREEVATVVRNLRALWGAGLEVGHVLRVEGGGGVGVLDRPVGADVLPAGADWAEALTHAVVVLGNHTDTRTGQGAG